MTYLITYLKSITTTRLRMAAVSD